jgi:hypothetical protein
MCSVRTDSKSENKDIGILAPAKLETDEVNHMR